MENRKRPSTEPPSERQLARELGISRAFLWRAKQVAAIPDAEFEAMVESDDPPTVTALVAHGWRGRARKPARKTGPEEPGLDKLAEVYSLLHAAADLRAENPERAAELCDRARALAYCAYKRLGGGDERLRQIGKTVARQRRMPAGYGTP